jgi:hypothetical protein
VLPDLGHLHHSGITPIDHLLFGAVEFLAIEFQLKESPRIGVELGKILLELGKSARLHEIDEGIDCCRRNGEQKLDGEVKKGVLTTGHLGGKQGTEDVVVEREHSVAESFTLGSGKRLRIVNSHVEEVQSDRPLDVFGVYDNELAVKALPWGKLLQSFDRLDEIPITLHDHNGSLIGRHKLKVAVDEVLEQGRFASLNRLYSKAVFYQK